MPYVIPWERRAMNKGLIEGIELALKLKFGAEGQRVMQEIRQIEETDVLRAVIRAIETAATLDDVRSACGGHPQSNS